MPKFVITILLFAAILWYGVFFSLTKTQPDSFNSIIGFLLRLFLALSLTLSLPVYFYLHKKAPTFSNLRHLYRKSIKWSMYVSFGAVFVLGLRAFNLGSWLNIGLFLVFYFLMYGYLKGPR
ncbi:hypothetical protein KAZ57_01455 [Patescibacteria group bacterium]|nr:hypothetical protein [Patescibacteria group bacterium]